MILSGWVLVSVASVGCVFNGAPSEETEALDLVVAAWEKSFNSHDAKALSMLYSEDADLRLGRDDLLEGRDAIEKKWAGAFAKDPQVETKLKVIRRRFLTPTIVLEDGVWEEWGHTDKNAQKNGVWSSVLVKKDGKWLYTCDRGSAPVPKPTE